MGFEAEQREFPLHLSFELILLGLNPINYSYLSDYAQQKKFVKKLFFENILSPHLRVVEHIAY